MRITRRAAFAGLFVVAALSLAVVLSGTPAVRAKGHDHAAAAATTARQAAFHDAMRKLWADHVTWTRLAIVSFAHDLPDLPVTQERLLRNQVDIGNSIKPYYGRAAGNQLTALLTEHITGAVALLQAVKAADQALIAQRIGEWRGNGREVADFLNRANPRNWSRRAMRRMMSTHLDQTIDEAVHRFGGDYAADVRDYEAIHRHILRMADTLSDGIIKQFPRRFR